MKKIIIIILSVFLISVFLAPVSADDTYTIKVSAPNGAPALAVAALAAEAPENYTFVAADTIPAEFANKTADFIIAPINAGAKLYKAGKSDYKLAAVVTWGNLYIASQKADFALEDINGAAITLFGENTINASVVLFALAGSGLEPAQVDYLAGAANTQTLLLTDENAIVVTAEPALTAAKMKNEAITAYAVNDLLKAANGFEGFTQAGLFVNADTIANHPEAAAEYLDKAEEAANLAQTDPNALAEAAVALEILPNVKVAQTAIPNCAISFVKALDAKDQIEATAEIDLSQFGGSVPTDDFYYEAK
ncbi:MAG: hypothetical protein II969_04620 [Anaerolineaceae bacterium]|nr:hypothetical protein [Anaerolineaceae bacterium]